MEHQDPKLEQLRQNLLPLLKVIHHFGLLFYRDMGHWCLLSLHGPLTKEMMETFAAFLEDLEEYLELRDPKGGIALAVCEGEIIQTIHPNPNKETMN